MKNYIVYFNGVEVGLVKAGSHNAAEKKALKLAAESNLKFKPVPPITNVQVTYTEV